MGSIKDVAKESGVSVATVSRVYNNRPNVKDDVREKVLKAAEKIGYNPKVMAKKELVVVVIDNFEVLNKGGYGAMLTSALTAEIVSRNLRLEMIPVSDISIIQKKFVKAIISIAFQKESVALLRKIKDVPIVFINDQVDGEMSVSSDTATGIAQTLNFLKENGHNKIGFIQQDTGSWCSQERVRLMKNSDIEVVTKYGNAADINIIAELAKVEEVTAIFAAGEEQGPALVYSLNMLGLRIPEDISVICFEHNGVTQYLGKGITSLKQNFPELSKSALDLALGKTDTKVVNIPHEFIERKSVRNLNQQ